MTDMAPRGSRPTTLPAQVAEEVLAWLRGGEWPPGSRLPPERELAARLGVSRTSLRAALRHLELLGYLRVRQGDGTYAQLPGGEALARPFQQVIADRPQSALDLLEFRLMLEPEVAALAARRLTPDGGRALTASLERQRALRGHGEDLIREDARFHDLLAGLAGNATVLRVLGTLRALLQDVRLVALPAAAVGDTVRMHDRVVQAVLAQDQGGARRAMRAHLEDVAATYHRALDLAPDVAPGGSP